MPCVIAFDTLAYAKKMRAVGFTEDQAEAQIQAILEIVEEKLATKQDIRDLKRDIKGLETSLRHDMKEIDANLRRDMKELETSLKHDIKELELTFAKNLANVKAEIIKWVAGMLVAQAAIAATLLKLLL